MKPIGIKSLEEAKTMFEEGGDQIVPHESLVYQATLDDRYIVQVIRKSNYVATLHIWDARHDLEHIYENEVALSFAAMFGPDQSDVLEWQDMACEFIDSKPQVH